MTAKEMEMQKEINPKIAKLDIDVLTYLLSRVLDLWKADDVICRDIAPEWRLLPLRNPRSFHCNLQRSLRKRELGFRSAEGAQSFPIGGILASEM